MEPLNLCIQCGNIVRSPITLNRICRACHLKKNAEIKKEEDTDLHDRMLCCSCFDDRPFVFTPVPCDSCRNWGK